MAKFYDAVGYGISEETPVDSGIYVDRITEYPYYGDVIKNSRRMSDGENLNSDIKADNSVSIVADEYANQHIFAIRYVKWAGARWTVTNVEVKSPRLILHLGEVYNGPTP